MLIAVSVDQLRRVIKILIDRHNLSRKGVDDCRCSLYALNCCYVLVLVESISNKGQFDKYYLSKFFLCVIGNAHIGLIAVKTDPFMVLAVLQDFRNATHLLPPIRFMLSPLSINVEGEKLFKELQVEFRIKLKPGYQVGHPASGFLHRLGIRFKSGLA